MLSATALGHVISSLISARPCLPLLFLNLSVIGFAGLLQEQIILALTVMWWTWRWQNNCIFSNSPWPVNFVIRQIHMDVASWCRWSDMHTSVIADGSREIGVVKFNP